MSSSTTVGGYSMGSFAPMATDSIGIISQDMKTLVKKIQDLRHLGIEDSKIALPRICVVGDQSTGKSSLIEGMSEIKVPRSAGTCTRCPMEINLSESEPNQPWTCRILLSKKYIFDSSRKITRLPRKSHPLGPWIEQDQEDEHFITLTHRDHLQEALRWAQLATLNPGRAPSDYVPGQNHGTDPTYYQVKFSPNVVRLDISAPEFPNLSFYDLPGVISQAEFDEERYLVSLVENLVKEYVSQESCIVLLTLPMTDDATNSSAARLIRDIRGATARTLGVLTKPDRVQDGEYFEQWIEILSGDKFSLGHGYYVVRNNPDSSIEHSQARDEERSFFSSHPWSTHLLHHQERFGTRRLQSALSTLLLEQIQGCLPRIIEQIDEKATHINEELKTLPDAPSANIPYILCGKINDLKDQIRANIDGGSSKYPLQKIWNHLAMDFKLALLKTRPTVQLLTKHDQMQLRLGCEDGDSDVEMVSAHQPGKRKSPGDRPTPSPADVKKPQPNRAAYFTNHFDEFSKSVKRFDLEEIRGINEDSYRAGIPDQTDPKAIEIMNQMSVSHWDKPMAVFLNVSHKLVREMLIQQLDQVFAQYHQTSLYRELKHIITRYLQRLRREHMQHAQETYEIECNKPFTMATSSLESATRAATEYLRCKRLNFRAEYYLDHHKRIPKGDARREAEKKKLGEAELGHDQFTQELKMMATTRGYYDIASSRFVDTICQSVYTKLFSKCREGLIAVIEQELGIFEENALERCLELMAEDPDRQRRRQFLLKEKEKVSKAQEWLATARKDDDDKTSDTDGPLPFRLCKSQPPEDEFQDMTF